jgi:integrase
MSYKYRKRPDTGRYEIFGPDPRPWKTYGPNGFRQTTRATSAKLVREEAATLYKQHAQEAFHGPGRPDRKFAEIAEAYFDHEQRSPAQKERVIALSMALGDVVASTIDNETVAALKRKLIKKSEPSPATVRAIIIGPLKAVLNFGYPKMCGKPVFKPQTQRKSPTLIVYPDKAQRIIDAAAPHLRGILTFIGGVGSRATETLALTWDYNHPDGGIDLVAGIARIMQKPKRKIQGPRERIAKLPPAVIAMLANLPPTGPLGERTGQVFRWESNVGRKGRGTRSAGYAKKKAATGGGQFKTALNGALRRAGCAGEGISAHTFRHAWASWHYAIHKDLLLLQKDGGWESLSMVARYAHQMPAGHEADILTFWGYPASVADELSSAIHTKITLALEQHRLKA